MSRSKIIIAAVGVLLVGAGLSFSTQSCDFGDTLDQAPGQSPTAQAVVSQTPTLTPPSDPTPSPVPTPTLVATPSADPTPISTLTTPSTPIPVATCPLPDAPALPQQPDAVVTALVGEPLVLDGSALFGMDAGQQLGWAPLTVAPDSLIYTSAHDFEIDSAGGLATATFDMPGKYRLSATGVEGSTLAREYDLEVVVRPETGIARGGVNLPDLFERLGGPEFSLRRDEPSCQEVVFDHAYSGPVRVGADVVVFHPAVFLDQIDPVPRYVPHNSDLSLTDDVYFAELVGAAHSRGLRVMMVEQDGPYFNLSIDDWIRREDLANDPVWMEAWFDELGKWVVPRAARAEAAGVEMYIPFNDTAFTLRPGSGYDQYWRDLVAVLREVFSGDIGVWIAQPADHRFTFSDVIDVVVMHVHGSSLPGSFPDPENPTYEQAAAEIAKVVDRSEDFVGEGTIYYSFGVTSSNGQTDSEIQAIREGYVTDFQEQALLLEAFLNVVADRDWIDGALTGMDWFDQYARDADNWYYDATNQGSSRSKPAEQVMKLWFGAE